MPVTKALQHFSPAAFNRCKQECTDSYLGDLSLHEAQQQQHITSLSQQPFSLPACLPALKASQKHVRDRAGAVRTQCALAVLTLTDSSAVRSQLVQAISSLQLS